MKKRNENNCDVLISGAGIPGLTLAILLGQAGIDTVIVDPAPKTALENASPDTRTVALMQGSIDLLKRTGAWECCASAGGTMNALKIIDDSNKNTEPLEVVFSPAEIGQDIFGMNMPNNILRAALVRQAEKTPHVRLWAGCKLSSCTADDFGISATIEGQENLRAQLVVGADGRNSTVRKQAGIDVWEHDYGQSAMTCFIEHTLPHNGMSTEFHRSTGPFALVPLPENLSGNVASHASSIVWVDFTGPVEQFMKLDKQSFEQELQGRSNGVLGNITLSGAPQSFPLKALKAKRLTAKRMALIAEAAHVLHPLTAQGLNLSLRDVAALAHTIIEATETGLDAGSAPILERYESSRRNDVALRVHGTDTLNRFISNDIPPLRLLRRAGLRTVGSISFLKDFVMQQGMAPPMAVAR